MKKFLLITLPIIGIFIGLFALMSVWGGELTADEGTNYTIWNALRAEGEGRSSRGLTLRQGRFEGTGSGGHYGDVSVAITVSPNNAIVAIEVIYSNETPSFADPAYAHLIPAVINAQHAEIDVFSGATQTSAAFLNAVADAMRNSAGIEAGETFAGVAMGYIGHVYVDVTINEGAIVRIEVTEHSETPAWAVLAFPPLAQAVVAAQHTDVDIITDATASSVAFLEAVQMALDDAGFEGPALIEGDVYVGVAHGYIDYVHVAVTINNGTIVHIEVTEHNETPGFANMAFPRLIQDVISSQSPDIDVITDATSSSNAFIDAVRSALEQHRASE